MAEAISIEVTGIKQVQDSLQKIEKDVQNINSLNKDLGTELVQKASALAPKLTGALAASIGSTVKDNKLEIYAGNSSVVYAGVQEYGWPEKNIKAQPYLRPAIYDNINNIVNKYEDYVKTIVKKYD